MGRGIEGSEMSTPRPSTVKKPSSSSQSNKTQKSILGFFQKKSESGSSPATKPSPTLPSSAKSLVISPKKAISRPSSAINDLTPAPSSDALEPSSPTYGANEYARGRNKENGLPSPVTPADMTGADGISKEVAGVASLSSPSHRVSAPTGPSKARCSSPFIG